VLINVSLSQRCYLYVEKSMAMEVETETACVGGGLVRECAEQPSLVVLHVSVSDRWIWKLHSS
jgi:hypothetical protein